MRRSRRPLPAGEQVVAGKLVHGGQSLAVLADGRKVFIWNALPGERVELRFIKSKKDYAEAIAEHVLTPSDDRIDPKESQSYLATSPWQMMNFSAEQRYKKDILSEAFLRESISLPEFDFVSVGQEYGYRNKMEWGFWGDDQGLHLAHFVRGSHGKVKVNGSMLAADTINSGAAELIAQLNTIKDLRAGDLKSVIVRTAGNQTVAALFVKQEDFPELILPQQLSGLVVYYSNPKSPASLPTHLLQQLGSRTLTDTIMGVPLSYDVLSFFQVNIPVFSTAVGRIDYFLGGAKKLDFYSGVGSIGIPIGMTDTLVESDPANVTMARQNVGSLPIKVVEAVAEKALEFIDANHALIVDPPRAGLHADVVKRILHVCPPQIAYLSCNPSTQARDIAQLTAGGYHIRAAEGYNFFPRTPHIESLVVLDKIKP